MKKILFLILIISVVVSCKAQIIAVEDFEEYPNELPDGAYIKDVNGVLNKYVGTWKGTYNTKSYEFIVVKVTKEDLNLKFKEDLLLIRYKITDANGVVLENTLNLPDDDIGVIKGRYLAKKTGSYVLSYIGKEADCGQKGTVFIGVLNNSNNKKAKLFLYPSTELLDGNKCSTWATQILPTEVITLTKQ
ncbi:hypothetical protein DS884_11035 [Tenacibaculum sp. E3R01]|uniref:DUF6705 family protein n=1 Tax=Tenacibaculum sp. E3R01 TaxID=2267227 RepID=UPI000DEA2B02|nr:DUF6705 family protein [Tenacibaculum sp. E3R01]RBW57580.1 hypothetical protein DS884_11035 [Tenacibaculum sp. E3R01]